MDEIDFKRIAAAALSSAETLVPEWLPNGRKVANEWRCGSIDGEEGDSFAVNLRTGVYCDFANGDVRGPDLVALYADLFHGGARGDAARELAEHLGIPEAAPAKGKAPAPRRQRAAPKADKPKAEAKSAPNARGSSWVPVLPVPDDAPEPPKAHEFRGLPERVWTYRDAAGLVLGYVYRFLTSDGGKEVIPLTWCHNTNTGKHAWRWLSFPEPRPLYGLDRLAAKPDATVLVVEGEKCADVGDAELPDLVCVSWPGGGKAVDKTDWTPLLGRRVITFADSDAKRVPRSKDEKEQGVDPESKPFMPLAKQPGYKAMATIRGFLATTAARLWDVPLPPPGEQPDGWDIADMVAQGTKGEALAAWLREQAQPWSPDVPEEPPPPEADDQRGKRKKPEYDPEAWRDGLNWKKGELTDSLANVYDMLANRQEWQGVLGFNEFSLRAVKLKPPPFAHGAEGEWEGVDDSRTAIWLARQERITPSSMRVMEAVETLARANSFHPVRQYLYGLPKHDGTPRIDHWLCDYLGVADTPYVRLVARWFLIGMVARVMQPGVKFDTCLVLEGAQGKGKSTALSILAGEFFDDTDLDLNNKDAMASLQGVWLHEFAELGSLAKAEASKQKSFLTRRIDKYRPVYGRRDIKAPRQTAFAGSVNDWEWQKDPTGGRRFWPVLCTDALNLDGLAEQRDQLFAEALAAYQAKERFWPTPEQQATLFDPEQLQRETPNNYVDALHDWVYRQREAFPMSDAILDGLKLDASKMTTSLNTSVGIALRKLGCTRVEKRNGMTRYWYEPPKRNGATSTREQPARNPTHVQSEDDYVPF